eukprot:TRINITY_DN17958_c0_g1_i1.p2 TRINITY_DN17958_c0_g1~~TRINITY_DN17958_c0_g1_i1.p2  ORF type:complete len:258 (+),score=71.52 TRINITY_DN17958_c0_g1_i1:95-775(+)
MILALMHGLQQACNHPASVTASRWPESLDRGANDFGAAAANSGKLMRFLEILEEILETGEKALVFTQYLGTLDLLASSVRAAHPGAEVLTMRGDLSREERQVVVRRFQEEPACSVLVCTLGTGGVGLNLTAASHVIHFDRCWNPAKEAQATDRAHRIGQRRAVVVHRLLSRGTLEERIDEVLRRKATLASEVVPRGGVASTLSEYPVEELRTLLALSLDARGDAPR